jgi:hypothetical protein
MIGLFFKSVKYKVPSNQQIPPKDQEWIPNLLEYSSLQTLHFLDFYSTFFSGFHIIWIHFWKVVL